jgi:cell division protein ZapA
MAALLLADELWDSRSRMAGIQGELARLQSDQARIESKAVAALDAAAKRIEKIAAE